MPDRKSTRAVLGAAAAATLTFAGIGAAGSDAATRDTTPTVTVLNQTVLAPYHLSASGGRLLVADGGTSTISRVMPNGNLKTVVAGPNPGEVAGVAAGDDGLGYTSTDFTTGAGTFTIHRPGHPDVVADISGFEAANNPDQHVRYGVEGPVSACVRNALTAAGAPIKYTGVVDSHAYAAAYAGNGSWYVADAAGNDILKVSATGAVSLVRVLPKQPVLITKALAQANGLPPCAVGITYDGEPVPTGVHVFGGSLFVSTLPGGASAPNGSIYRMNRSGGGLVRVATGFLGATDVAVGPQGRIYVAQLYSGEISLVWRGHTTTLVTLPSVVSVAYGRGHLYAGTVGPTDENDNPTGPGSIVQIG